MKHKLIPLIIVLSLCGLLASAQSRDVRSIFLESPDYVIPALGATQKQELIDRFTSAEDREHEDLTVQNVYGGKSQVLEMTDSFLHISLDPSTSIQIKLLPLVNNTSLICMIVTSNIMPQLSVIRFYDIQWLGIDTDELVQIPPVSAFLKEANSLNTSLLKEALTERGSLTYLVSADSTDPAISIRITTFDEEYVQKLHPGVAALFKPDGLRMVWNRSHFELQSK